MSDEPALRLLDLVRHRLAAADARIEIGGEPPRDPHAVWVPLGAHRRVVAVFGNPPEEDAGKRLATLVDAFAASADSPKSDGPAALGRRTLPSEIDAELEGLCVRADAACALLIDGSSPVIWGRSHAELGDEIEPLLAVARAAHGDDAFELLSRRDAWPAELANAIPEDNPASLRRVLVAALALDEARAFLEREPKALGSVHRTALRGTCAFMMRSLAGVYVLILAFDGAFSEPQAEGVFQRAQSQIEKLIVSLPPTDPPPRPGRVLAMRKPH
jgi:hypothetical protein